MSRKVDDIPTEGSSFPPAGKHLCKCMSTDWVKSKVKKTDGVELTWMTMDGDYQFTDTLWVSEKAIGRLALVAKRLCPGARELELEDNDYAAAGQLADFIIENLNGKDAVVEVIAYTETFMHESGDKIGQKETREKKRVAYSGYEAVTEKQPF